MATKIKVKTKKPAIKKVAVKIKKGGKKTK
jgi:hypothetical protein